MFGQTPNMTQSSRGFCVCILQLYSVDLFPPTNAHECSEIDQVSELMVEEGREKNIKTVCVFFTVSHCNSQRLIPFLFLFPSRYYERTVIFCSAFVEIIPLSFILGFYVSFTANRWWQQYTAIPWPDK